MSAEHCLQEKIIEIEGNVRNKKGYFHHIQIFIDEISGNKQEERAQKHHQIFKLKNI